MSDVYEMLRRHEGLRLKPYRCTAGKLTIGYGWNLDAFDPPEDIAANIRVNGEITPAMAERLLFISVGRATDDCKALYDDFDDFTEARKAALIDFMFNVGSNVAHKFVKMYAAIIKGDWDTAADEMFCSGWRQQVGGRAEEIIGMIRTG